MDRRKTLATVGAISLTASAAVVALGSSMGLFGLTNDTPRVGKLSPIDATQPARTEVKTIIVDDPVPVPTTGIGDGTSSGSGSGSRTSDHRTGADSRVSTSSPGTDTVPPAASTTPSGDDHHGTEPAEAQDSPTGTGAASSGSRHEDD